MIALARLDFAEPVLFDRFVGPEGDIDSDQRRAPCE
jgi:hypothetical protein